MLPASCVEEGELKKLQRTSDQQCEHLDDGWVVMSNVLREGNRDFGSPSSPSLAFPRLPSPSLPPPLLLRATRPQYAFHSATRFLSKLIVSGVDYILAAGEGESTRTKAGLGRERLKSGMMAAAAT